MKIILDAMGGDLAPAEQVAGGCMAAEKLGVDILLCGDSEKINEELKKYSGDKSRVSVKHCSQVIENEDDPVRSVRRKQDSSLVVGLRALKNGEGSAFVSAGNTGALIAGSSFEVGRLGNVSRPALAPVLPTSGGPAVLMDAGANAVCKPENLYHFAVMGSKYMEFMFGIEKPRVGLVNIGAEEHKGTPLTKETYQLLKTAPVNFIGNVEARDILLGAADVYVTDGFTGNVVLKLIEGAGKYMSNSLKTMFFKNFKTKLAAVMLKDGLKNFKKQMDYKEYGGAPVMGADAVVIKAHGSSDAYAVYNAVRQAKKAVETNLTESIKKLLEETNVEDAKGETENE